MESTSTTKIYVLQGVCATLITIAYFLPWFQISFWGSSSSFSFLEIVVKINETAQGISDFGSFIPDNSKIRNYAFLLYLIPISSCFNTVMQWTGRYPRLAFYLTLAPFGICIALIVYAAKTHVNISEIASFGFYIALLAGFISFVATWTTIGFNYYTRYKGYLKILTICTLVYIGLNIIALIIAASTSFTSFMEYDNTDLLSSMILVGIFIFWNILGTICSLHFPFIVYAWIVVLLTKNCQERNPVNVGDAVVERSHKPIEETVKMAQPTIPAQLTIPCLQCHKEMSADWELCPYCGYNPKEAKLKKEQEDDNLRFSPPQWRNDK